MHKVILAITFLIGLSLVTWGQGAAGAGGGGGGGGSNLYGFRYFFLSQHHVTSKSAGNDTGVARAYILVHPDSTINTHQHYYSSFFYKSIYLSQNIINGILLGTLKITKIDSLSRHIHRSIPKITQSQYFLLPDPAQPAKMDTSYIVSTGALDTFFIRDYKILYPLIVPFHRLSFYILGRSQDTIMLEVWPRPRRLQNKYFDGQTTVIDSFKNENLYSHDLIKADTFYAVIPWKNQGLGPRYQTFNLLFGTKYFIPITIPIGYTFRAKAWQTNFLNAGMAYGWAIGRTKFYRDGLQASRNFYWGAGLLAGVSNITLNMQSLNPAASAVAKAAVGGSGYNLPGVYTGAHLGLSFNSIQLMVTGTYEWAFGSYSTEWIYQHRFSLGVAIGLSSFNLAVPNTASAPLGH